MSNINGLIRKMCPNGVKYKKLFECCNFQNGFAFKSNLFRDDGEILLRITNICNNKIDLNDIKYISISDYKEELDKYIVKEDEIVIAMSGATTGKIGINKTNRNVYLNQRVGKITPMNNNLNNHFLYHYLLSKVSYFYQLAGGGAQPNLSADSIKNTLIPVPPIKVQEEIVKILDKFSNLEKELEEELEERKKQYEFWREKLLNVKDSRKKVRFGEIANISRGASPRPIKNFITDEEDGINWIKIGDINPNDKYIISTKEKITLEGATKSKMIKPGDFILSNSMSFGRAYISKINGCIHDGWLSISKFENTFMPDFLYHLLSSKYIQNIMKQKASIGTVQNLNADIVKSIELPLYTIEQQKRIVGVLDKFEKLTNDLTDGLPAEIELRKKQYEYYRNELLNFKEVIA